MKQGWNILKLSDACTLTMGQSPISESYNTDGDGLPFFQGCSDFGKINPTIRTYCNAPTKIAEANDVLMSVRAPIGTLNIANVKCCIGRGLASFRATSRTTNSYLYYFLKHSRTKLESLGTGSTFKAIGKDALSKFPIPVPPIEEQKAICSLLDNLNLVIEKKKEQIAELDNLAQSLFFDMFGDILETDPTRCLKDVAEYYIGLTYSPDDVAQEGCIVLRSSNIQNNVLDFNDTVRVKSTISDKKKVRDGDILMCARNGSARLVGKVARIRNISEEMSFGAFMTIIRSQYNDFLFHFFLSHYFRDQLTTSKTATINQITTKMLDGIKLNVPPLPLQQAFAEKVEAIERQKELINQSIKDVQTLFDAKMDYYFGE